MRSASLIEDHVSRCTAVLHIRIAEMTTRLHELQKNLHHLTYFRTYF